MNNPVHDVKLLLCFDALMTERSVSRAARRLNLSQPAMSHALARLRRQFDDPLLLKGRGVMTPTTRALQLEAQVRDVLTALRRLAEPPAGFEPESARRRFTVMAPEYAEYLLAPPLTARLQQDAPGVSLDFRASDPDRAVDWLASGDLDFRLGWWPEPPPALRYKLLFRDRLVCLVGRNHPRHRHGLRLEDYLDAEHARLQTPRTSVSTGAVDHAVAAYRRTLDVTLRVQNLWVLAEVIATTSLVATLPERLAATLQERHPLQLLPLPLTVPDVRMALYWHERTHKHAAHRWFRQVMTDVAKTV